MLGFSWRPWLARSVVLSFVCPAALAHARTFDGVSMPDQMVVDGQTLVLNGMGLRTFTFLRIHGYVAGLYVPQAAKDPVALLRAAGIKLLRVQYVHAASLGRVQDEFRNGRALNCAAGCPKSDDPAFAQLFDTARAVQPGDTNTYIYAPEGLRVLFDDKIMARIPNADFAQRMLSGMIGDHPPTPALRAGLLGLVSG